MKSSIQLTIAGITGGLTVFALTYFLNFDKATISDSKKVIVEQKSSELEDDFAISSKLVNQNFTSTSSNPSDFTLAAEKTVNAVVHIQSEYESEYNSDPLLDFFWGPNGSRGYRPQIATGSGVIISKDGYIITNNHVIEEANKMKITLNDGRELNAQLIGADKGTDLALLKVDEQNLPYTEFGNSDNIDIGDWVLAVGNPFNLTSTVTAGIVSAKARSINILRGDVSNNVFPLESFIQTDAAVNPGNSGGALVSPDGLLVGINTAIASNTGSYSGYSFAIPSNLALKIVNDLKKYGTVQRAFIGVIIKDIDQELVNELNLPNTNGVYVSNLSEDGAAKDAGIIAGDIILKVDNKEVNNVPELQEQIGRFRPGDKVNIIIKRNNETLLKEIILRNQNGNTKLLDKIEVTKTNSIYGASFKELSYEEKIDLKINHGVKIQSLNSGKLKNAGLKSGFIITHIDKEPVKTVIELVKLLKNKEGGILIEGVYTNGVKGYFGFGL